MCITRPELDPTTAMAAARYYSRPGVTFIPIHDLEPCRVVLAWWPNDTSIVADLVTLASRLARTLLEDERDRAAPVRREVTS